MGNLERSEDIFLDDRNAWFEDIMDAFGENLTKLAYTYVKDWKIAEDVVQDVFIICYKQYENLESITSFKSWIYRITINRSKDVLKSSSIRRMIMNPNLFHFFRAKDLSPEMAVVKRSEEELLSVCVLALPLKYREVISLYYYEDLQIEEISKILKMNKNTIKTRLNRARGKLKKLMERCDMDGV
ncbi:sigma-70 family RNA polymerase sigma factor [Bacillus tianshenii]|uniref:sigma-70 family RNA polymerase sigma factor n=1 Tax=Sutcliffiella tianshenii TaxID=1463404 RepID=UPI001CD1CCE4|nr:sigma-70 family RNA polymerase sigma factor [Bacillus tianshenii]MCA1320989.1 sigma-70 family RNA polymerase sigma factor [Bacillus tianshenii]